MRHSSDVERVARTSGVEVRGFSSPPCPNLGKKPQTAKAADCAAHSIHVRQWYPIWVQTPAFVTEVLKDYDTNPRPVVEYQIASALIAALQKHKPLSEQDEDGFRADLWAFTMHVSDEGERSCLGTHFGPRSADASLPDMKQNGPPLIEHWQRRVDDMRHPVLRARYSDLVWDLKRVATGERPDIKFARLAIDSYLEAISSKLYHETVHGIGCATRALSVALSINDKQRVEKARGTMFALYDVVAIPYLPGTWIFLFDALYANRKVSLSEAQRDELVKSLEEILAACVASSQDVNLFAAEQAAKRLERHYNRIGQSDEVDRVVRLFGQAVESLGEGPRASQGLVWLQPLVKKYHDRGMEDDAARANQLLSRVMQKVRKEMKEVSVTVPLDKDKIERYLNALTSGGFADAIKKIAVQFIPRIDDARRFLQESENNFPFSSMFGSAIIRESGIVAAAGSISGDPEARLLIQLTQFIDTATMFLAWAIDKTREIYAPTSGDLLEVLYQSPAFDPMRKELLRSGLDAYLSDDLVKAVHILLPQIEHTLLRLGEHMGMVTREPSPHNPSAVQWVNLFKILQGEKMRECLGENLTCYLQMLLVDPLGHNIRNHVSHGHLNPEDFTRQLADRVIHVVFALSLIRERQEPEQP